VPIGSGAQTLQLLPDVPYVIDPATFMAQTSEQVDKAGLGSYPDPGASNAIADSLPDSGIVSALRINFKGTLTVVAGGTQPVPGFNWPYGLIRAFTLSANGMAHDLWSVNGNDLDALSFVRNPNQQNSSDIFPGAVGGGGSALGAGTYTLDLTWDIPIAIDEIYLVAALFAQSSQTTIRWKVTRESEANLIAPGGTAADWTIAGTWNVVEHAWEIPIDTHGNLVLPDIRRLHTVVAVDQPFTNTGDVEAPLLRTAGQMMRLFLSGISATNVPMSALGGTAAANRIDALRLRYGLHAQPLNFDPATVLVHENEQFYGAPVPYDRYVLDFVKRNPARDMVMLQGITNLRGVVNVDPAVAPTAGQANIHAVEEILI